MIALTPQFASLLVAITASTVIAVPNPHSGAHDRRYVLNVDLPGLAKVYMRPRASSAITRVRRRDQDKGEQPADTKAVFIQPPSSTGSLGAASDTVGAARRDLSGPIDEPDSGEQVQAENADAALVDVLADHDGEVLRKRILLRVDSQTVPALEHYQCLSDSGSDKIALPHAKTAAFRRGGGSSGSPLQKEIRSKGSNCVFDNLQMRPTKKRKRKQENAAAARAALAAKRRKLEDSDVTEEVVECSPKETDTEQSEYQNTIHESPNLGEQNDVEMIDAAISTEGAIITPPEDVAAAQHNDSIGERVEYADSDREEHRERAENCLPFGAENELPDTPANESYDALVEEQHTVHRSVATVVSSYQNAKIPQDGAADALKRLDYILYPSKCAGTGYRTPKLDSMFSIRRLTGMAACLRFYTNSSAKTD
ncbi:hypothetical protein RhiJN_23353 [Ceratobasidium sp. AG-Ba]|nr:hypothetical protein RhiJN_23353 [Ceratobasidium sp. AG-Ba]